MRNMEPIRHRVPQSVEGLNPVSSVALSLTGTLLRRILRIPVVLHRHLLRAVRHDCFNLAQSTAYSAMVALFPALIVTAAIIGLLPDTTPLRFQLAVFFDRILPPDVSPCSRATSSTSPTTPDPPAP